MKNIPRMCPLKCMNVERKGNNSIKAFQFFSFMPFLNQTCFSFTSYIPHIVSLLPRLYTLHPYYENILKDRTSSCILKILMWWKGIGLDIIYYMMHAFNFWQKYFIVHLWKHEEIPFAVALFWQPYHFTLLRWFCTKENAFLCLK